MLTTLTNTDIRGQHAMKTLFQPLLLVLAALALAGAAYAQVPSSNDTSDGFGNTGMGTGALQTLTAGACQNGSNLGCYNTAAGSQALQLNTTGEYNTAVGAQALLSNTIGGSNTALGEVALQTNTAGSRNTAVGSAALEFNTASDNTALGILALQANTTGNNNTATGEAALLKNTTGSNNTGNGLDALLLNTTGNENTASGVNALGLNTTGSYNTASGVGALYSSTTGSQNTASGVFALYSNTTGSNNIAEGYQAGYNLTTGSNDIDIGNVGVAGEDNTIRIGTKGTHKVTVIAGIDSSKVTGSAVYVTTTGRLGVLASSERFKVAISPMESKSAKLGQLRPVTFHLKSEPKGALQYGLIAEEVAKVYPELVIRNELGRIDGVRYDELAPMLLNEMQKKNAAQDAEIHDLKKLVAEMQVGLLKLQSKDELVAKR
jgi:hypothetical protein